MLASFNECLARSCVFSFLSSLAVTQCNFEHRVILSFLWLEDWKCVISIECRTDKSSFLGCRRPCRRGPWLLLCLSHSLRAQLAFLLPIPPCNWIYSLNNTRSECWVMCQTIILLFSSCSMRAQTCWKRRVLGRKKRDTLDKLSHNLYWPLSVP